MCYECRERLNPEDGNIYYRPDNSFDWPKLEPFAICDSPTPENKESQGEPEKSDSAVCPKCEWPPYGVNYRLFCMCGQ